MINNFIFFLVRKWLNGQHAEIKTAQSPKNRELIIMVSMKEFELISFKLKREACIELNKYIQSALERDFQ